MSRRTIPTSTSSRRIDVFLPRRAGRLWTYAVPDGAPALSAGQLVAVPFGKHEALGVCCAPPRALRGGDPPAERTRSALGAAPADTIPPDLWQTLEWAARYYMVPLPVILEQGLSLPSWRPEWQAPPGPGAWGTFVPRARVRARGAPATPDVAGAHPVALNAEQSVAAAAITADIGRGAFALHLLEGVTGSGKTEVYAAAIATALARGRSVLVLVPEIALAQPLAARLGERLGRPIAVWHSAVAKGRKGAVGEQLLRGDATVLVGARSAVFAPLSRPALIVVDEEHDGGLAQSEGIGWHARDVAVQRARHAGATVVLGSATPSLEAAYAARQGRMAWHRLTVRARQARLPTCRIVDLQRDDERGPLPWLSRSLHRALEETLGRREQAVLFRNRRGFHPVVLCRDCGESLRCDFCAADLTLHARPVHLKCHLCGARRTLPEQCPHCGRRGALQAVGTGTQRVEHELQTLFPDARIDRLDRDRVTSAARLDDILARLRDGRTDVLVGTQMVTKGLDIPGITLVGIVQVDGALHMPDFRAAERAFQQVCQVAGRAGRGDRPGHVLIQTLHPEHPVLRQAVALDYPAFYAQEIAARAARGLPPLCRAMRLLWTAPRPDLLHVATNAVQAVPHPAGIRLLGPASAPLDRVAGQLRVHALALADDWPSLRAWASELRTLPDGQRPMIHVDPASLM